MVGYIVGYKTRGDSIPNPLGNAVEYVKETDYIECTYTGNQSEHIGIYEEGKFMTYAFEIIVDENFDFINIQLFNYHKKPITEIIKVTKAEYLDLLCKTKLLA